MLRFDGFCAAALADDFFLIFDFGEEFDDVVGILLEVLRVAINGGFQDRSGHAAPSQTNDHRDLVYKKEEERFATGALRKKKSAGERRRRRGKITELRGTKSAERHSIRPSRFKTTQYPESYRKPERKALFATGHL